MKRLLLMVAALVLSVSAMAQEKDFGSYVQVTGRAVKEFTPNEFYLWITINERDSKGKITVEEQQRALVSMLKRQKIDVEKQLKLVNTSGEFLKRKTSVASNVYELKLVAGQDVAKIGQMLADLGLSKVSLRKATHTDLEQFKHEVRRQAVLNARATAKELAEALGQKVGRCCYINDSNFDLTPRYNNMLMTRGVAYDMAPEMEDEPSLDFKSIKIEYSVQTKFVLE